jgi:hypothetical protein
LPPGNDAISGGSLGKVITKLHGAADAVVRMRDDKPAREVTREGPSCLLR